VLVFLAREQFQIQLVCHVYFALCCLFYMQTVIEEQFHFQLGPTLLCLLRCIALFRNNVITIIDMFGIIGMFGFDRPTCCLHYNNSVSFYPGEWGKQIRLFHFAPYGGVK